MNSIQLAEKIEKFLTTYGKRCADDETEWSSPDAAMLDVCAKLIYLNKPITFVPWSEWGSGGYGPYTSPEGRIEHNEILKLIDNYREGLIQQVVPVAEENYGVHASHCCAEHGCKYGHPDCPVVKGRVVQKYKCETCDEDERELVGMSDEGFKRLYARVIAEHNRRNPSEQRAVQG